MKTFIPENSLPILPKALEYYKFSDFLMVSDNFNTEDSQNFNTENTSKCANCGNDQANQIYYFSEGTVAGGTNEYGYHCDQCNKYTYYSKDWG